MGNSISEGNRGVYILGYVHVYFVILGHFCIFRPFIIIQVYLIQGAYQTPNLTG